MQRKENEQQGPGMYALSAAVPGWSVRTKSWMECVYPYSMNTSEKQWHVLLPKFLLSHPFPYTDILPVSQQQHSERSPRPFVNVSPPLLEQILHSTSVFSTKRWFPRGFKASRLVQTTFSHLTKQHRLGSADTCIRIYLIKRRAPAG